MDGRGLHDVASSSRVHVVSGGGGRKGGVRLGGGGVRFWKRALNNRRIGAVRRLLMRPERRSAPRRGRAPRSQRRRTAGATTRGDPPRPRPSESEPDPSPRGAA
jgi:hypothetical protein